MGGVSAALVNDYEVVVRGLAAMLRSYRDRVRVLELDANRQPAERVDVALFDTFGSAGPLSEEIAELAENPLIGRVAVYSWDTRPGQVSAALACGADGYISKGLPAGLLAAAIEAVGSGGAMVHAGPGRLAAAAGDWPGREEGLTQREAQVLALITQGLSNDQVALALRLSPNSVKTHIRGCYRRIGASTRTQAALWGVAHGFRPDHVRIRRPDPAGPAA